MYCHDERTGLEKIVMNFRCTVNGGLEDLAMQEIKSSFPASARISWIKKGQSGSQLAIELAEPLSQELTQQILKLRFVEYVYYVVYSQEHDISKWDKQDEQETGESVEEMILAKVEVDLPCQIQPAQLHVATDIGRNVQKVLRNSFVGLEPLPGELLPAPQIENVFSETPNGNGTTSKLFDVNTIYTKDAVARAVVKIFVDLSKCHLSADCSGDVSEMPIWWLDAGAGAGALLRHLPEGYRLGVDVAPGCTDIVQADFLDIDRLWLQQNFPPVKNGAATVCAISNPPFADGSRGHYSSIVQFLNHAFETLGAKFVGLIVPAKFSRTRIWASLGMTPEARLLARFVLPQDSFLDPSSDKSINIQSHFLFFGTEEVAMGSSKVNATSRDSFYLHGKRDKGDFPNMATSDLVSAAVKGLSTNKGNFLHVLHLTSERQAEFPLLIKLRKPRRSNVAELELWLLLNPERPLSLANSICCKISQHSLGWMSMSIKPPVANAMLQNTIGSTRNGCALVVNAMTGEGTIEIEAQNFATMKNSFFLLSGDNNETSIIKTRDRLMELHQCTRKPFLSDLVVWDAERLPLRGDVVDLFIADMPIGGSRSTNFQPPSAKNQGMQSAIEKTSLDYRSITTTAIRVLRPLGEAALISTDTNSLVHSTRQLHWRADASRGIHRVNVGGLNAQFLVLQKLPPCYKDLSVWIEDGAGDLSCKILARACESTSNYFLDLRLKLQQSSGQNRPRKASLVRDVFRVDEFFHQKSQRLSHCYRFAFDNVLTNFQVKTLERVIREDIKKNGIDGVTGLR